jgi:hypothetical protein
MDESTAAFLQGGCALIIGTVGDDGEPRASRGWGLTIVEDDPLTIRLLLTGDDEVTVEHLRGSGRVAITAADVPTLRSVQLKGRALTVEDGTAEDWARAQRFMDAFFGDVNASDGTPRRVVDRVVPTGVAAATVVVDDVYDQTPGPTAGSRLAGR